MKTSAYKDILIYSCLMACLIPVSSRAEEKTCPPLCAPVCPPPCKPVCKTETHAYAPGTVGLKPVNFNFGRLAFGHQNNDSFFSYNPVSFYNTVNNVKTDAFRRGFDMGFAESDRHGFGYGVELGVVVYDDWELFGRFGYCREKGNGRFNTGDYSFDFKNRNNYGFSFGPRKYFDFQSSWKPFVQLAAGFTVQGKTSSTILGHPITNNDLNNDIPIGNYKLTNRKTLFTGELGIGTDYAFTDYFALSFSVAVRYNQRGGSSTTQLPGLNIPFVPLSPTTFTYKSNIQRWVVPFTLSLKFMF
jgi:hypothetical protein